MAVPPNILHLAHRVVRKIHPHLSAHTRPAPVNSAQNKQAEHHEGQDGLRISLLASGGYNDVWHVEIVLDTDQASSMSSFILRVPNEDSLKPHQLLNEVGWLSYVAKHCPNIPVPKIYDFSAGGDNNYLDPPYLAMEYVDAQPLSTVWRRLSESEKHGVARKLATLTVQLGEQRFPVIGGMDPSGTPGPTVEGAKLFKGRNAFHAAGCYNIGPYPSIREYILACYDREIYYYSHASTETLDMDLFDNDGITTTPAAFVEELRTKRSAVETELQKQPRAEPFVLCHEDFQARNILMQGTEIVAVIDWEFAGSFPLSELVNDGIEVLEYEDGDGDGDDVEEECLKWGSIIMSLVEEVAKERSWSATDVELLVRGSDRVLQAARVEMMPGV